MPRADPGLTSGLPRVGDGASDEAKGKLYRGARLARIRCKLRRCMFSRRAVSETLRLHISLTHWIYSQRTRSGDIGCSLELSAAPTAGSGSCLVSGAELGHGPKIGAASGFWSWWPERKTPPGGMAGGASIGKRDRHCGTITRRLATSMSPGHHTGRESQDSPNGVRRVTTRHLTKKDADCLIQTNWRSCNRACKRWEVRSH